jgi:hypothetical protein
LTLALVFWFFKKNNKKSSALDNLKTPHILRSQPTRHSITASKVPKVDGFSSSTNLQFQKVAPLSEEVKKPVAQPAKAVRIDRL